MLDSHIYKVVGTRKYNNQVCSLTLYNFIRNFKVTILPSYTDKVDDPSSLACNYLQDQCSCDNYLWEFLMKILGLNHSGNSSSSRLACFLKVIWISEGRPAVHLTPSGLLDWRRIDVYLFSRSLLLDPPCWHMVVTPFRDVYHSVFGLQRCA